MRLLDYFTKNFGLYFETAELSVGYGIEQVKQIEVAKGVDDSFWDAMQDIDAQNIVWKEWNNIKIPFLFSNDIDAEIITKKENRILINYDIVASAFYFLSGWNEYVSSDKDDFNRVKFKSTLIHKLEIQGIPVVNYYFDIFRDAICQINGECKEFAWQEHDFAVALSHDIDVCKRGWLEGSFSEIKKKKFFTVPGLITNRFFGKDDWFNFDKIIRLEKKYNANSTFYFLPQKGKVNEWKNADYDIQSKDIKGAIQSLFKNGNEIGVHGSFGTHDNHDKLNRDIGRIPVEIVNGNRFHFLMFDVCSTVSVLEKADIKYDTSIGFAEQIGFRRSTCLPFYLYNFEKGQISSVLEIPLVVMDASLMYKRYMGLSHRESVSAVIAIIEEVKKFNGVFSILWHNTSFSDYKYTGWREVYEEILSYCQNSNALMTSNIDIYNRIVNAKIASPKKQIVHVY